MKRKCIIAIIITVMLIICGLYLFINRHQLFYSEDILYENPISQYNVSGDFTYDKYDTHAIITTYSGDAPTLEIPAEIDGLPVWSIADSAFYGNSTLQSITFPDGLLRIGHQAFIGCENLAEICIPKSVVDIGMATFMGCKSLEKIQLYKNSDAAQQLTEYGYEQYFVYY